MSYEDVRASLAATLATVKLTNLIENPSFEVDDVGIALDAGLVKALDTTHKHIGAQSLKVTGGSGSSKNLWVTKRDGTRFAVEPDEGYVWAPFIKPGPGQVAPLTRLVMEWFDSGGASVRTDNGSLLTIPSSSGFERYSMRKIAPATAATVRVGLEESTGWTSSKDIYFDALMLNKGALMPYIDGEQPGCEWDGGQQFAHTVASNRTIRRVYDTPPGSPQDLPCYIFYGPAGTALYGPGGTMQEEEDTLRFRLLVRDADLDVAAGFVEAFRAAMLAALAGEGILGGHGVLGETAWQDPAGFRYGGNDYIGQDYTIRFQVKNP
jgi:hypothetical protein